MNLNMFFGGGIINFYHGTNAERGGREKIKNIFSMEQNL